MPNFVCCESLLMSLYLYLLPEFANWWTYEVYLNVKNRPVYATVVSIRRVTNILANIWCFIIYGSFVFIKKYIQ